MRIVKKVGKITRGAFAYDQVKGDANFIVRYVKKLFGGGWSKVKGEAKPMNEAGYSKEQILAARRSFRIIFSIYVVMFFAVLVYLAYNIAHADYLLAVACLALLLLCVAQAFKYHFWLFQIKKNKLGCTFSEWFDHVLAKDRGDKS